MNHGSQDGGTPSPGPRTTKEQTSGGQATAVWVSQQQSLTAPFPLQMGSLRLREGEAQGHATLKWTQGTVAPKPRVLQDHSPLTPELS